MRWNRYFTAPLMGLALVLSACGGEPAEEAATDEAAMAAAPATPVEAGECYLQGATREEATARPSPLQEIEFTYLGGQGRLCYGAPAANDREVMGALVPYGALWRAGANEPTTIHLSGPATVGGVALEPGSYSIYAEPGESEWTFYINSNFERWGIPISDEVRTTEVGTFTATPEPLAQHVETLTYLWEGNDQNTMGDVVMQWETTQLRFHVHSGG